MAEKSVVRTDAAPAPFQGAPYSQAVRYGDLVFVAGQVGAAAGARRRSSARRSRSRPSRHARTSKAILEAAGSSFDKVLNTTIYLTDFGDFPG